MVGDSADIKYDKGLEDPNKPLIRDSLFAKLIAKYEKKIDTVDLEPSQENEDDTDTDEQPKGLMARRTQ